MSLLPKPQLPKAVQKAAITTLCGASPTIANALAAGTITQDRVNAIVSAAIELLRAGE